MLATRRDVRRIDARIQSTHGGFNGPYGKKVKTWTQEGRTRQGQARGDAHSEKSEARGKAQEHRAQDDSAQEDRAQDDGAQEDRAQGGAEEGGIRHSGDADADAIGDGAATCGTDSAETAVTGTEPAAAAGDTAATAAGDAVLRLVDAVDAVIGAEAVVRELVFHAAEAARQQLGQRLRRRFELLAILLRPLSPSGERGVNSRRTTTHNAFAASRVAAALKWKAPPALWRRKRRRGDPGVPSAKGGWTGGRRQSR